MIVYIIKTKETIEDEIPVYVTFVGSDKPMVTHELKDAHMFRGEGEANEIIKGNENLFEILKVKVDFEAV